MTTTPDEDQLPTLITPDDVTIFGVAAGAKLDAMIEDATSQACTVAPCLTGSLTMLQRTAVRAVLRAAIIRWDETGAGVRTTMAAGPFNVGTDTSHVRKGVFWPSEITALQAVCKTSKATPFAIDMAPHANRAIHVPWCDINFGSATCSCGADIAGKPIFEVDD